MMIIRNNTILEFSKQLTLRYYPQPNKLDLEGIDLSSYEQYVLSNYTFTFTIDFKLLSSYHYLYISFPNKYYILNVSSLYPCSGNHNSLN